MTVLCLLSTCPSAKTSIFKHCLTIWISCFHPNSELPSTQSTGGKLATLLLGFPDFKLSHQPMQQSKSPLAYLDPSRAFLLKASLILSPCPDLQTPLEKNGDSRWGVHIPLMERSLFYLMPSKNTVFVITFSLV